MPYRWNIVIKSVFLALLVGVVSVETSAQIDSEFDALKDQNLILVPVGVGDITIFIPVATGIENDPGDSGDINIEGIDADNDGIRDDVEHNLAMLFPGDSNQTVRTYSFIAA